MMLAFTSRPTTYSDCVGWASHWSQRWFLDADGEDRLQMGEAISGGWATHVDAYSLLLRFALKATGHPDASGEESLPTRLKRRGLDRAVRQWASRIVSIGRDGKSGQTGGVAIITEIPTPSMLDGAIAVAKSIPDQRLTVASGDPRVLRAWRRAGYGPRALTLPLAEERANLRRGRDTATRAMNSIKSDPPTIPFGPENVAVDVLGELSRGLDAALPWLAVESRAVGHQLDEVRPSAVLLTSDQHRMGRLVCEATALRGIPTFVLQHGLPQARIGLLPVVADHVVVWSESAADWFVRHQTPREKIEVTGNPRLDPLASMERNAARRRVDSLFRKAGSPRILLALSPTSSVVNRAVVDMALQALISSPKANLVIKLHPGEHEWDFVSNAIRTAWWAHDRIRVIRRGELLPLLLWADATVLHRSTVAVESLAARTPVVVADAGGALNTANLELGELGLSVVRTGAELAVACAELSAGPARDEFFQDRARAIERLVGPVDGDAHLRIAALLTMSVS